MQHMPTHINRKNSGKAETSALPFEGIQLKVYIQKYKSWYN